jgi:hypothetical protein
VIAAVVLRAVVLISGPFSFLISLLLGRGDLSFERGDHEERLIVIQLD